MTHFRAYLVHPSGDSQTIIRNAHPEPRTSMRAALDDFLHEDNPGAEGLTQSEWVENRLKDGAHVEIRVVEAGSRR